MSDNYRDAQGAYYQALVMGQGNLTEAFYRLKTLAEDPEERTIMDARLQELTAMENMCGDAHSQRDYVGSIELKCLKQILK